MNTRRPSPRRAPARHRNVGFTLIEVLIAIVLSGMISGAVAMGLFTALNVFSSTNDQVADSTDAGLISSFLVRDAQSAGGIDPATALPDDRLGISTLSTDFDGITCLNSGGLTTSDVKARFEWIDRTSGSANTNVVVYTLDTTSHLLTRHLCTNGTYVVQVVLGRNILSATPTCQYESPEVVKPDCGGHPTTISMELVGNGTRAPMHYTVTASLRSSPSLMAIMLPAKLEDGRLGVPYASPAMTTIGASAQTKWSATFVLPVGLAIDPWTGMIFGTPNPSGPYPVTSNVKVTVADVYYATTATRTYTIVIHGPPVAKPDPEVPADPKYVTNEDTMLTVVAPGVLANDSRREGNPPLPALPTKATLATGVAHGKVVLNSNGSFTYTPELNWSGSDSFTYRANDTYTASDGLLVPLDSLPASVTLTVNPVNDAPVNRVPVAQETAINTAKEFSNAISISDVDAGVATVRVRLTATNGTVTLPGTPVSVTSTGSGTAAMTISGTVADINVSLARTTFTPTTDFTGGATLTIATNDLGNFPAVLLADTVNTFPITIQPLGIFTNKKDIGVVSTAAGSTDSSYLSPTYTVKGSGWDIFEANDGFQFIYRAMTTDGSVTARIVSETVTYPNATNQNPTCRAPGVPDQPCKSVAKAGVMFRQELTSVSAINAMVGASQGNGSQFTYRTGAGATTGYISAADTHPFPYWVRLTRHGNQITAEVSQDGTTWTPRGVTDVGFVSPIYVGLAASAVNQLSGDNPAKKLNTALFDNVSISTPPVAVADSYPVSQNATFTVPPNTGVLANDSDPESNSLTAEVVSTTPGLTLNSDGSFTYVPPVNFSGATFTYVANDGAFDSAPVTVTLAVSPLGPTNRAPSFTKGANQSIRSNLGARSVPLWATAITPGAGEAIQSVDFIVTNITNPSLFSVQPAISADGTLTFASAPADVLTGVGANGTSTVTVVIHDSGGTTNGGIDTSAPQTFTITIVAPPVLTVTRTALAFTENAPPTAVDPSMTVTDADSTTLASATVAVAGYVSGQDVLGFTNQPGIIGAWNSATGVLALSGPSAIANYQAALSSVTYRNTSDNPSTSKRAVTFVANDGVVNSNIVSRPISITAVNDAPVAAADNYSVNEDATLTVPALTGVLSNDTDAEGNPLTAVFVSGTAVTFNSDGSFTYVPPAYFSGTESFTYRANDGSLDSNVVTVTLTVVAVNDVPSFTKGADQSAVAGSGGQTVAGWATNPSQGTGDAGQAVDFIVTNNNNSKFSVQPAISATGTLTYTPSAAGVATVSVKIHDNGGTANGGVDTSAVQTFTITITDTTGPTGGTVDAGALVGTGNRYSTTLNLSIVLNKGADPSGIAPTGNALSRATATLTSPGTADGVCGAFGPYTLVSGGTDPVSPKADSVPAPGCYKYQYVVKDTLGNSTTYTSPEIKVDTSVPTTPLLAFSAFTNAYWSGSTLFYNSSTGTSGSFTATATATDATSGILSYAWPALGAGWSSPGTSAANIYTWTPVPAAPGTKNVTATNNATSTSANSPFTLTADPTVPAGGAVSYLNGTQTSTTISVTVGSSSDAGSGLATWLLQRASATLSGTTCGGFTAFSTVASGTTPATSPLIDTVNHGKCYQYKYFVTDKVGNVDTNTSARITKNN